MKRERQRVYETGVGAFTATQETPAGKMCYFGRLDRAYDMLAADPSNEKITNAIEVLKRKADQAFATYRQALEVYAQVCRVANVAPDYPEIPPCQCKRCTEIPMMIIEKGMKAHDQLITEAAA